MQGIVGAPPLTHLCGGTAIAPRKNAASRLRNGKLGVRQHFLSFLSLPKHDEKLIKGGGIRVVR
jgi:hypothetical protein